jgi:hypothetical protein
MVGVTEGAVGTTAEALEGDRELLLRHRPVLLWDSQDDFRALAADSIAVNPGNVLEADGRVVAPGAGGGEPRLSLDLLSGGIDGVAFDGESRFKEGPFPFLAARRLQQQDEYANRVYGRAVRPPASDRTFLQYWIWLYYNPKHLLGFGRHEGDWELVQVALDRDTEQPVTVTYAQHGRGERKDDLSEVEWESCALPCVEGCRHPKAYVAPFSHASYFEAGTHFYLPGTDNPDGAIREELVEVEELGDWVDWPGRWGQQRSSASSSPRSPAHQPSQWDPERFEDKARKRKPRRQRLLWRVGAGTFPEPPALESALLCGDTVAVRWRVARKLGLRPSWLLVTVHDADAPDRVIRRRTIRVDGGDGETRIPLSPGHPRKLLVRVSAFNWLRQRSDASAPLAVAEQQSEGDGLLDARDQWSAPVWKTFRRVLVNDLVENGAATVSDLERRRIDFLELALDRKEILAVVESARRTGLVEPLGHEQRADGATVDGPEWAVTDEGHSKTMSFGRWLRRFGAVAPSAALLAVSTDVIWPWLRDQRPLVAIGGGVLVVVLAWMLAVILYRRVGGASGRTVARSWSRHAVELPALNRSFTWWNGWTVALGVLFTVCYFAPIWIATIDDLPWTVDALLYVSLLIGTFGWLVLYILLLARLGTRYELRREAKECREGPDRSFARTARAAVARARRGRRRRRRRGRRRA